MGERMEGEIKEEGGNIGQKMICALITRFPFLSVSGMGGQSSMCTALRRLGPGREPASQPALFVSGAGLRPGTNAGIDCLAEESWA